MRKTLYCLFVLSLATIMLPTFLAAEESSGSQGTLEIGGTAVSLDDDQSRVNKYTNGRSSDGANAAAKFDLDLTNGKGAWLETSGAINGSRDAAVAGKIDLNRALRFDFGYTALENNLAHDQLDYFDAAVVRGGMNKTTHEPVPLTGVNPDLVPAFVLVDGASQQVLYGSDTGNFSSVADDDDYVVQTGGAAIYGEDLVPATEFAVTRREWKIGSEATLPGLPNLTLNVDYRNEHRYGEQQSIGMSKCATCHITGLSKTVDETTEDFKAGVTGKFGLVTMEYEFANRQFKDNSQALERIYDPVIKPGQPFDNKTFDNRMTYDYNDGGLPADTDPNTKKRAHLLKGRVDLPGDTSLLGSYVASEVESYKTEEPGIFTLSSDKLTTSYDGYKLKVKTRIGQLKLSAYGKLEKVEGDNVEVTYQTITAPTAPAAGVTFDANNTGFYSSEYESLQTRDVLTAGIDARYRLARRTTLRLGYAFESEDREDQHFGKTETNTFKAQLSARPLKALSLRLGYTFADIENPFGNPEAALVEVDQNRLLAKFGVPGYIVGGNSLLYGTSYYDARIADLSSSPEQTNEFKFSGTYSPLANFSATISYRFKDEENDLNHSTWGQTLHSPSISLWYAANQKLNVTATYNYFDQRTETAFCQGFYDG